MPVDPLLALFAAYNPAIWPLQLVAYAGVVILLSLIVARPSRRTDQLVSGFLAVVWLFIGIVFHGLFVRRMDAAQSVVYAAGFAIQAALLVAYGVVGHRVVFARAGHVSSVVGWTAVAYALVVYPLLGIALGHPYPQAPLFGAAPCPTTILTLGVLLLARPPLPRLLLVVPLAWALVATPAAVGRGIVEDVAMLLVAVLAVVLVTLRDRRPGTAVTPTSAAGAHPAPTR